MFGRKFVYSFLIVLVCLYSLEVNAKNELAVIDKDGYNQIFSYLYITKDDVVAYKKIFRAIKDEKFHKADNLIEDLNNDILMGHVLAEKYLSKSYNSQYEELKIWLEKYSSLPQAKNIYRLAVKKGGGRDLPEIQKNNEVRFSSPYSWFSNPYENLSENNRKYVKKKVNEFRKYINQGKTLAARRILEDANFRKVIPNREYDAMSATLAMVYLLDNEDKLALQRIEKAVRRSQDATAAWVGGLAAWRLKQYKTSVSYFTKLGAMTDNDEWLVAAGAYWAYRAYDKQGQNQNANKWLRIASKYKRTFYGILASYKLGAPLEYNWTGASFLNDFSNYDYINELLASAAIRRAVLLIYAKQYNLAEQELRADYPNMTDKQKEATMYIANQYKMHSLSIMISNNLKKDDEAVFYDRVAYPTPEWKLKSEWKLDRALVLALVRQESGFMPKVGSGAGAKGLMQLMPNTAVHITKDKRLKKDSSPLLEEAFNLDTGQKYVNYLLDKPFIAGNLFFLTTAYNAGPGNLVKWQKKMNYNNDPLLFIEVVPARETRIYIERVIANFWVYSAKFGQEIPSLQALSNNEWPMYGDMSGATEN